MSLWFDNRLSLRLDADGRLLRTQDAPRNIMARIYNRVDSCSGPALGLEATHLFCMLLGRAIADQFGYDLLLPLLLN